MDTLSDRVAANLRTARLSPRSFAKVVGCHFATIYRVIRDGDENMHGITRAAVEAKVEKLEELIETGFLPFDRGLTKQQTEDTLQQLFADQQ